MSRANNPPAAPAARSIQIVGLVALVVGIIGLYPLLTQGGRSFNQGSALAWGLPVVTYAFLALASFGVAMVAMLGIVVRQPVLDQLARRHLLLAFSLSIGAIIALALELGHPFRALWAIPLNIQLRSPLLWMGVCWGIYLLSLIAGLLVLRQDGRRSLPRGLSILILVSALAGLFTQGLVYGMMSMRPVWFGFATPLYFLVGSLPLGLALISLFGRLTDGSSEPPSLARGYFELQILPRLLLAALVLYFITWLGRLITGLWTVQDGHQVVYAHMVESPLFYVELLLGLLLPLALLISPARGRAPVAILSALCIIGGLFIARYEFVIGGQLVPLFKGTWSQGLITYAPSITEWMVTLTGVALAVTLYGFGRIWLYGGRDAVETAP
jgi:molybdopterin-containing oxidoreductase family membrane subunit